MATTREIINEIKGLRGTEVRVFGQPTIYPKSVNKYTIDICDVLEELEPYELDEELTKVSESETDWNTSKFEVVANRLADEGYIEDVDSDISDNSYNWSAPISNDFNLRQWNTYDGIIVAIMVHRYGDVRSNYTDYAWYKFDDEYEFNELLYSVEKCNEVECKGKAYWCCTNLFDSYITVTPENGEGQYYVYDYIETDEEMVKAIEECLAEEE